MFTTSTNLAVSGILATSRGATQDVVGQSSDDSNITREVMKITVGDLDIGMIHDTSIPTLTLMLSVIFHDLLASSAIWPRRRSSTLTISSIVSSSSWSSRSERTMRGAWRMHSNPTRYTPTTRPQDSPELVHRLSSTLAVLARLVRGSPHTPPPSNK